MMSTQVAAPRERGWRGHSALGLIAGLCAVALAWGWRVRDEVYLDAKSGTGYALGIVGTAFMVLLLFYSLRKRVRFMRSWGPIGQWFRIHMALGLVGPAAILFHSGFQLGSVNSTVALVCVIVVAASGVVGRFIYPKIHHGLYGRRATLAEIRVQTEASRRRVESAAARSSRLAAELSAFDELALEPAASTLAAVWRFLSLPVRARVVQRRCLQELARGRRRPADREAERALRSYFRSARRVAEFGVYERIFALWHAFHLPVCVLLFLAATVHVVAVHMY